MVPKYRSGSCRNDPGKNASHTYMEVDGELYPMCGYGWNRSDGQSFSILRGPPGTEGSCKLCQSNLRASNLRADKRPVMNGWPHPTKWL